MIFFQKVNFTKRRDNSRQWLVAIVDLTRGRVGR